MVVTNGQKASSKAEPSGIPVVDFAKWTPGDSSEEQQAIARDLVEACQSFGFVNIINHGLDPNLLAEAFGWSKKLFDLSYEEKMKAPHPDGSAVHRGYSYPGLEKVSQVMNESGNSEVAKKLREVQDCKVSRSREGQRTVVTKLI
jgi:isopenicillin N synthase-like dioxygenase